jgi:two-component system chemotaxis sensor kinase CheA
VDSALSSTWRSVPTREWGEGDARTRRRLGRTLAHLRSDIAKITRGMAGVAAALEADRSSIQQRFMPLDDDIRRMRMIPFGEACEGLDRALQKLSGAMGKDVELVIEGRRVELDRSIMEALKDPLLQLIRNAVDHGIEVSADRERAGKPPRGRISVSASIVGSQVKVTVSDDGNGIQLDEIRQRLRERGKPVPDDPVELSSMILEPGFSTRREVSDFSGRGVGLDIVRAQVEAFHGTVTVRFEPGRGTSFVLAVPITLTKLRVISVEVAGKFFAIPSSNVLTVTHLLPGDLCLQDGREEVTIAGEPVPLFSLGRSLNLLGTDTPILADRSVAAVVIRANDRTAAFTVDRLLAESVVVVKSLGPRLTRLRTVAGATSLRNGQMALILSAAGLVRGARVRSHPERAVSPRRVLVVDDSITTRFFVRNVLEVAGYTVLEAPDGFEGWKELQEKGADLVITDLEMPRMDGFALAELIRTTGAYRLLPILVLTSLSADQRQVTNLQVGVPSGPARTGNGPHAYLPKSECDEASLLQTVARLLGRT